MEKLLEYLVGVVFVTARISGWICGLLLTVSAVIIGIDIVLRNTVVVTIGGANELAGYALAIASSWGCTVALAHRMHVRINSLYTYLGPSARALLDFIGLLAFVYFMGLVTWYAGGALEQSIISSSRSISALETPLAIPQLLWFVGFLSFLFSATVLLGRAALALIRRDFRTVRSLIGARSVEEEIELEKQSLGGSVQGTKAAEGTS